MKRIQKSSLMKRNFHKFVANKMAIVGLFLILLTILLSVLAPLFTRYDPSLIDPSNRLQPPSADHLLGTDRIGRDLWSRLLYGGRMSIFVGLASALMANFIGVALGCISGFFSGKVDAVILYISEIFMVFPQTILIFIMVGFAGQSISNVIIIFSITGWPNILRIVRSRILSLKEEAFVENCRICGVSSFSIMFRHLLPNTFGPIIVNVSLATAGYVLAEAGLSFIGLGVPSDIPTWGTIINAAKSMQIIQQYPLLWIAPGVMISLFVLGINFFGDGLRDVFDKTQ